jgi:predicted nucleotidyltransferase
MTVHTYLTQRASDAVLSANEKTSIGTSIATLKTRLDYWFSDNVSDHFTFGSYTRDTILPRSMDASSDIDYMVVFSEAGYTPQTYLNRLKTFVEKYYSSSEISQSNPTIALDLNHIRFELVPALSSGLGGYHIPNGTSQWQFTNPNDFNQILTDKNKSCGYFLKPTIRLIKMWNANRGYIFNSYGLEKWMAERTYFFCSTIFDHLESAISGANLSYDTAQWRKDALERAKTIVADTRAYLKSDLPVSAETEIKKLIPA